MRREAAENNEMAAENSEMAENNKMPENNENTDDAAVVAPKGSTSCADTGGATGSTELAAPVTVASEPVGLQRKADAAPAMPVAVVVGNENENHDKEVAIEKVPLADTAVVQNAVKGRLLNHMYSGICFSMGLAWRNFAFVAIEPENMFRDPGSDYTTSGTIMVVWLIALLFVLLAVPCIMFIIGRVQRLQIQAEECKRNGDDAMARVHLTRAGGLHAFASYGLAFLLATQLDGAIQATISTDSSAIRLLYAVLIVFIVSGTAAVVAPANMDSKPSSKRSGAAQIILSGSAYIVALAFFTWLHSLLSSDEEAPGATSLWVAAVFVTVVVSGCMWGLSRLDLQDANAAAAGIDRPTGRGPQTIRCARSLLSKALPMCAALTFYALLFYRMASLFGELGYAHYDMSQPLPTTGALIIILVICILFFGHCRLKESFLANTINRLEFSSIQDNAAKELAMETSQLLIQTTSVGISQAYAFLVGMSIYECFKTFFWEIWGDVESDAAAWFASLAFAILTTILSGLVAGWAPPGPQSA
eukprot:NODE_2767_length_2148_cov_10.404255.p1 GENE.NODE_2767_length_2148_cov_10.404255~~NODE_2767_length_2148_cov_10.404255.p1  ORF type:complete len:571 (+),score=84.42 NODE_2767_length_2148_cov_10.404255:120-1715(+)